MTTRGHTEMDEKEPKWTQMKIQWKKEDWTKLVDDHDDKIKKYLFDPEVMYPPPPPPRSLSTPFTEPLPGFEMPEMTFTTLYGKSMPLTTYAIGTPMNPLIEFDEVFRAFVTYAIDSCTGQRVSIQMEEENREKEGHILNYYIGGEALTGPWATIRGDESLIREYDRFFEKALLVLPINVNLKWSGDDSQLTREEVEDRASEICALAVWMFMEKNPHLVK